MKTYYSLLTASVGLVFVLLVQNGKSQCTQVTNIRTFITDNQCPTGTITYHVYYFSEAGSGTNSLCYGYAVSQKGDQSGGFIRSAYFGPVNQGPESNASFSHEMDITINCDQIATLFIHGWNQPDCKGDMCPYPISQVVVLSPLPVELATFRVSREDDKMQLEWVTWGEINSKGFTVQHSRNGMFWWENIGFVSSRGNSQEKTIYHYQHEFPVNGVNYYRLGQLDLDGTITYSPVVQAYFNTNQLSVHPTMAIDILYITTPYAMKMNLYTSTGVLTESWYIDPDQRTIDISGLRNGMYYLQGEDGSMVRFYKF